MSRFDKPSFSLGVYIVGLLWSATSVITSEDAHSVLFVVLLALMATFAVLAVQTVMDIRRKRATANAAHIDTEGVYAALRCTGCSGHLMYLEHGHDLSRLIAARDSHDCSVQAEAADHG